MGVLSKIGGILGGIGQAAGGPSPGRARPKSPTVGTQRPRPQSRGPRTSRINLGGTGSVGGAGVNISQ